MTSKELSLIIVLYIVFAYISLFFINPHYDEIHYHLPTVTEFYNSNILTTIKSDNYKSASTPLPYILIAYSQKLIGIDPSFVSVRIFNIITSFLCLLLFWKLFHKQNVFEFYLVLILFFYPYFLKTSFIFFMAIYGIFFYLLFLFNIDKNGNKFISGLTLSLAILSQQFYLVLLVPYGIIALIEFFKETRKREFIKNALLFILPLFLVVGVFLIWDGLSHPSFRFHKLEFTEENLTSVLILIGSTLFPFAIFRINTLNKKLIITFICFSMVLSLFAYPTWVNIRADGAISGLTFRVLEVLDNLNFYFGFFIKSGLILFGFVSLYLIIKKYSSNPFLILSFVFLTIGFIINNPLSERHMIILVITGYLIVLPITEMKIIKYLWLPYQITIGVIYFIYINFFYKTI